jgi:hypothetical protein
MEKMRGNFPPLTRGQRLLPCSFTFSPCLVFLSHTRTSLSLPCLNPYFPLLCFLLAALYLSITHTDTYSFVFCISFFLCFSPPYTSHEPLMHHPFTFSLTHMGLLHSCLISLPKMPLTQFHAFQNYPFLFLKLQKHDLSYYQFCHFSFCGLITKSKNSN